MHLHTLPRNTERGFTLIELLVVIAIIGILSSVVLASLNDARESARDSALKQQVASYATMLETELASTGRLQNNMTSWIGTTAGPWSSTCAAETYVGPMAEDFRRLCEGIIDQTSAQRPDILHIGVSGNYNSRSEYSIMVFLNNGNLYCRGSSGRNYEGPWNNWQGSGCFDNP